MIYKGVRSSMLGGIEAVTKRGTGNLPSTDVIAHTICPDPLTPLPPQPKNTLQA